MLLSKVEKKNTTDCCPACKMPRSMMFSRGKNHEGNVRGGTFNKEREIYKNREFKGLIHKISNMFLISYHLEIICK